MPMPSILFVKYLIVYLCFEHLHHLSYRYTRGIFQVYQFNVLSALYVLQLDSR